LAGTNQASQFSENNAIVIVVNNAIFITTLYTEQASQ